MNELTKQLGLQYGVKFYVNRSDLYMDVLVDLNFIPGVSWSYNFDDDSPFVIIFLRKQDFWYE